MRAGEQSEVGNLRGRVAQCVVCFFSLLELALQLPEIAGLRSYHPQSHRAGGMMNDFLRFLPSSSTSGVKTYQSIYLLNLI